MKAKFVNEMLKENRGIPWSGKDPTKAPIIGKLMTRRMKMGDKEIEPEMMDVVEVNGDYYIINKWYKHGVPQVIHNDMVNTYIPNEDYRSEKGSIYRDKE